MIESAIRSAIRSVIMNKMLYVIEPALSRLLFFIPAKQRARQPCLHAWIFGDCREAQITCSLLRWNFDALSACCWVFDFVIGCYIFCVMK